MSIIEQYTIERLEEWQEDIACIQKNIDEGNLVEADFDLDTLYGAIGKLKKDLIKLNEEKIND